MFCLWGPQVEKVLRGPLSSKSVTHSRRGAGASAGCPGECDLGMKSRASAGPPGQELLSSRTESPFTSASEYKRNDWF